MSMMKEARHANPAQHPFRDRLSEFIKRRARQGGEHAGVQDRYEPLKKLRQAEAAANIEAWANSPRRRVTGTSSSNCGFSNQRRAPASHYERDRWQPAADPDAEVLLQAKSFRETIQNAEPLFGARLATDVVRRSGVHASLFLVAITIGLILVIGLLPLSLFSPNSRGASHSPARAWNNRDAPRFLLLNLVREDLHGR